MCLLCQKINLFVRRFLIFFLSISFLHLSAQDEPPCTIQPLTGPGGQEYLYDDIETLDYSSTEKGCWVYYPKGAEKDQLNLVVFVHGYGAINPMIFGKWIKHLVKKGNVVIYPRYQMTLFNPLPPAFAQNVADGINKGLDSLKIETGIEPDLKHASYVGHSYGGAIVTYLANYYEKFEVPKPASVFACEPGTGPFKDAKLRSYRELHEDLMLLVMVGDNDLTVGDELGLRIYLSSKQLKHRNFIRQYPDSYKNYSIGASHYEPYSLDEDLDSGERNFTALRAMRVGSTDAVDYYGYWKLYDALLNCSREGRDCDVAFGNTAEQRSLGEWEKDKPVRPLEIKDPQNPVLSENQ